MSEYPCGEARNAGKELRIGTCCLHFLQVIVQGELEQVSADLGGLFQNYLTVKGWNPGGV